MSLATGAIAEILFKIRCQCHGRDDNLLEASVLDSYQAPYKFKLEVTCDIRTTWFMITVNTTQVVVPVLKLLNVIRYTSRNLLHRTESRFWSLGRMSSDSSHSASR